MRPEFLEPRGQLSPELVRDTLGLVIEETLSLEALALWTRFELVLAYDWAMREHLSAAGNAIRRRPRPSFVDRLPRLGLDLAAGVDRFE